MALYKLNYSISSPGDSTTFVEFSPDGQYLAVGDRNLSSLFILDKLAGFYPIVAAVTPAEPTSLVWETSQAFYVGLKDGCFVYYQINLEGRKLVEGAINTHFYGMFPITAIALAAGSKILVLSVGPDVFLFQRIRATGMFCLIRNYTSRLTLPKMNLALLPTFQAASISNVTLGVQLTRSQDRSASRPTI